MPRRNLILLVGAVLVALICYQRVQHNPYGRIFTESLELVDRHALKDVGEQKLFEGAMHGMMSQLDKNSSYIPPEEAKQFLEQIDGEFEGVGIVVTFDPQTQELTILSPLYGSPASAAGIRAGDKILRIDNHSTQGMSLSNAVSLLRGKLGEPVILVVQHLNEEKPVEVKIVRGNIRAETVLGDTRNSDGSWNYFIPGPDRLGYLRIDSFSKNTGEEFRHVVQKLVDEGMQGMILDLRDDPGGVFDAAKTICDLFLPEGVIVTTRDRKKQILQTERAGGDAPFADLPLAILVNQNSASASEVVAACLQDHHRAVIVGQRTFGKGTVQNVIELEKNAGSLRLTTASYWRPSGKNIHRHKDDGEDEDWGVRPDPGYEIILDNAEFARWYQWRARRDASTPEGNDPAAGDTFVDRQREKAVEYLHSRIEKNSSK